jgi:hypothetical protein
MASEVMYIPEERLAEVIGVIRAGLRTSKKVSGETRRQLTQWCDEEAAYLKRLTAPDEK